MIQVPISDGSYAIVDDRDYNAVKDYKWHWSKQGRGVAAYCHDQKVLMHNLISPKARVKFKDGDKRNCQRDNLIQFKPGSVLHRKSRRGDMKYIYICRKQNRVQVRRNLDIEGIRYRVATSFHLGHRELDDALKLARLKAQELEAMTPTEFRDYALSAAARKRISTNQIISEWDCHQGHQYSMKEFYQMGTTNEPDEY